MSVVARGIAACPAAGSSRLGSGNPAITAEVRSSGPISPLRSEQRGTGAPPGPAGPKRRSTGTDERTRHVSGGWRARTADRQGLRPGRSRDTSSPGADRRLSTFTERRLTKNLPGGHARDRTVAGGVRVAVGGDDLSCSASGEFQAGSGKPPPRGALPRIAASRNQEVPPAVPANCGWQR